MRILGSVYEIINDFEGFLFDAYGVLVDESGLLPGAKRLIEDLQESDRPYWMLSNGSSKTIKDTTSRYQDLGLPFDESQVITSGSLLESSLKTCTETGDKVGVLGTPGSFQLVRDAGRVPVDLLCGDEFRVLVIANQTEYPFVQSVDLALSRVIDFLDRGEDFKVILTNPDLFYPKAQGQFGITAGSVSMILEQSLRLRYGDLPNGLFEKLGKPFSPMFDEAKARAGTSKLLMVGDQIYTDIQGAKGAGIGSLLVGTGLTTQKMLSNLDESLTPDFFVPGLERG